MSKAAKKQPENGLKRLEELLAAKAPQSFPAYVRANFARLSEILESAGRGGEKWQLLATWAHSEGHTGGRELSASTVKRAYEREAQKRRTRAEQARARPQAKPVQVVQPKPAASGATDDDDFQFRTLPKRPKGE